MSGLRELRPDTMVKPSLAVQWLAFDDEIVLFDPLRNKVYRFNGTGAFIWRCLERAATVAEIHQQISTAFVIDDVAEKSVDVFLNELLDIGVVAAHITESSDTPEPQRSPFLTERGRQP